MRLEKQIEQNTTQTDNITPRTPVFCCQEFLALKSLRALDG